MEVGFLDDESESFGGKKVKTKEKRSFSKSKGNPFDSGTDSGEFLFASDSNDSYKGKEERKQVEKEKKVKKDKQEKPEKKAKDTKEGKEKKEKKEKKHKKDKKEKNERNEEAITDLQSSSDLLTSTGVSNEKEAESEDTIAHDDTKKKYPRKESASKVGFFGNSKKKKEENSSIAEGTEPASAKDLADLFHILQIASKSSHLEKIREVLRNKPSLVESVDKQGVYPLHWAAKSDKNELLEYISTAVDTPEHLNITNNKGFTALHWCAKVGNVQGANFLLAMSNTVPDIVNASGMTPLHMFLRHAITEPNTLDLEKFTNFHLLLTKKSLSVQDVDGFTAMHYAACLGENGKQMVEMIVTHKSFDPQVRNVTNQQGRSPIHLACMRNARCDELNPLKTNFACNVKARNGCVPLITKLDHLPNYQDLDPTQPFPLAAKIDQGDLMNSLQLLATPTSLQATDSEGKLTLHHAVSKAYLGDKIVALLINRVESTFGSVEDYVNTKDNSGCTALHYAVQNKLFPPSGIKQLITQVTITNKDHNSKTPLHYAAESASQEILEILLASTNQKDSSGDNILLHIQDREGKIPLHYAAAKSPIGVEVLITKGTVNKQDFFGCAPLHYVVDHAIYRALQHHGAKDDLKDLNGTTPCDENIERKQALAMFAETKRATRSREDLLAKEKGMPNSKVPKDKKKEEKGKEKDKEEKLRRQRSQSVTEFMKRPFVSAPAIKKDRSLLTDSD